MHSLKFLDQNSAISCGFTSQKLEVSVRLQNFIVLVLVEIFVNTLEISPNNAIYPGYEYAYYI
jgi:hypothetical protein